MPADSSHAVQFEATEFLFAVFTRTISSHADHLLASGLGHERPGRPSRLHCSMQSSTCREWMPKGAGNGDPGRRY